jgi:molecular chaperone HscB
MNYFELFDIPVSLTIDKANLSKKYFELQKKYHPDFFTQANEAEQDEALEKSSAINKALKIFQHKDSTVKYVLQLKGLLEEEEKYQLPPDFLMEVMDLNEQLSADSTAAIAAFEKEIYAEVSSIIEGYNDTSTTTADLLKVKEYYFKKKYLQRILERLDD